MHPDLQHISRLMNELNTPEPTLPPLLLKSIARACGVLISLVATDRWSGYNDHRDCSVMRKSLNNWMKANP